MKRMLGFLRINHCINCTMFFHSDPHADGRLGSRRGRCRCHQGDVVFPSLGSGEHCRSYCARVWKYTLTHDTVPQAHSYTYTYTHAFTYTCTYSLSLSLSLFLFHTHTHSHTHDHQSSPTSSVVRDAIMLHPAFTEEDRRTVLTSMAQNRAAAQDALNAAGPPGTMLVQV